MYTADPVTDDGSTIPLELYIVTFSAHYYTTNQGQKKLGQVAQDIRRLIGIRHPNVLQVLAVKLNKPSELVKEAQLFVLSEPAPMLTLQDVLEEMDFLREARATEYLQQILQGLNSLHSISLWHRSKHAPLPSSHI